MAYLFFTGFESGDFYEARLRDGTYSIVSSGQRTGSYCLRTNPTGSNVGWAEYNTRSTTGSDADFNVPTIYVRFYFKPVTLPGSNSEPIWCSYNTSSLLKCRLDINSSGQIKVINQSGGTVATGSTTLSTGTYYCIEMMCGTGTSANYELRINGSTELSGTLDSTVTNHARCQYGKTHNTNGQSVNFYYDDIAVDDSTWPGAGKVKAFIPNANGYYTDFTASSGDKYQCVDDVPANNETDYIYSSVNLAKYTAALPNCSSVGIAGEIHCVKTWCVTRKTNVSGGIQVRIRTGTTDAMTSSIDPGTSYAGLGCYYNTCPADSQPWETGDLDSAEVGVKLTVADDHRVTQLLLEVDYNESSVEIIPTVGDISLGSTTPVVSAAVQISPSFGNINLDLTTPSVLTAVNISPLLGNLTLDSKTPFVSAAVLVSPSLGDMALNATTPIISVLINITPSIGNITLDSTIPSVSGSVNILPSIGDISLDSTTPTVWGSILYIKVASVSFTLTVVSNFASKGLWLPVVLIQTNGVDPLEDVTYSDVTFKWIDLSGNIYQKTPTSDDWAVGENGVYAIKLLPSETPLNGRIVYIVSVSGAITYKASCRIEPEDSFPTSYTYQVINSVNGKPVKRAWVWVSTDEQGLQIVGGPIKSDKLGCTKWLLDPGTYYFWVHAPGFYFANPDREEVY